MTPSFRIILIGIFLVLFSTSFAFRILARKRKAVATAAGLIFPKPLPFEGVEVPVLETHSGFKALAPVTFFQNNIRPKLVFYEDHFEYRVIFKRKAEYREVESLRSYRSRFYNKLTIKFSHSNMFLSVILTDEKTLRKVLRFLATKGIFPDEKSRI
ncbi:MAG: hypothetical protein J7L66_06060 [Anaerolineaceae bacterium]|nr:hypothetical protein [Anaerolineaceae bacterium]